MTKKTKKIHVIGGGTVSHVRSHLALAAPAYGTTARYLADTLKDRGENVMLHLTKMACGGQSDLETNADIKELVDKIVKDPDTKMVIFNPALADFEGEIDGKPSGKYAERLKSRESNGKALTLKTAEKIIGEIRKHRKDIFVVGFKTTTGASEDEQYMQGLGLLKSNSVNLVLANDTKTRKNMVITPEEARYHVTKDRKQALDGLLNMALARSSLNFTRSTVLNEKPLVPWNSTEAPVNLRMVVNHLITKGVYQPFRGKTAGHFAVRGSKPNEFLTSIRKTDFNQLAQNGLVRVEAQGDDKVVAFGAKPSVGGQSQRMIFNRYKGLDSIVHFHGELKSKPKDKIPVRSQWQYECGSHQCGENTADGLKEVRPGIHAVMLENHGPNIVFNRKAKAEDIISFIEDNFALGQKTGGNILQEYRYAA